MVNTQIQITQTTKSQSILILTQKQLDKTSHIAILDLETKKINPVTHPAFNKITLPNITKLQDNLYFISGGFNRETHEVYQKSFIFNTKTETIYHQKQLPIKIYDSFTIRRKNDLLYLGGRNNPKDHSDIMNTFYMYSLNTYQWTEMPEIPRQVSGIKMIFLDYEDNLVIILHNGYIIKFDFKTRKWINIKKLTYYFRRFYISQTGESYLYNEVDSVLYTYNFYDDEICTYMDMSQEAISDHFYVEEENTIYFLDNYSKKGFFTMNLTSKKIEYKDQDSYSAIFGEYQAFRSFSNCKLIQQQSKKLTSLNKIENMYIFGNEVYPMLIEVNKISGDVELYGVSESLDLKSKQIVTAVQDDTIMFIGGKRHTTYTNNAQLYYVKGESTYDLQKLSQTVIDGYTVFKVIDGNQYCFLFSQDVFQMMKNSEKELNFVQKKSIQESVYIPIILENEKDLTVFFCQNKKGVPILNFKKYDIENDQWIQVFSQQVESNINLVFSYPLDKNSYLVIGTKQNKEYLCKLTIIKNKDNTWNEVKAEEIVMLHNGYSNMNVPQFTFITTYIMLIQFVDQNYNLITKAFDVNDLKLVNNNFSINYPKNLKLLMEKLRMNEKMDQFMNFSLTNQFTQL